MISNVAQLVAVTITYDDIGQSIEAETVTDIFVEERSITRQEWSEAGRIGVNPDIELVTPFMNYNGELIVDYDGVRYSVYRTYRSGDNIELYLTKKGGV